MGTASLADEGRAGTLSPTHPHNVLSLGGREQMKNKMEMEMEMMSEMKKKGGKFIENKARIRWRARLRKRKIGSQTIGEYWSKTRDPDKGKELGKLKRIW